MKGQSGNTMQLRRNEEKREAEENHQSLRREVAELPDGVITERRCQSAAGGKEEQKGSGRQEQSVEQQREKTPIISQNPKKNDQIHLETETEEP